jgi:dolichol-phosphate mannosyltransferase
MQKLISIIVPVYNEQENLPLFYTEIKKVLFGLQDSYDFEIIFVNDGSADKSELVLSELSAKDKIVKVIEFSRNFGKEIATSAGLNNCSGKCAILIDADLQHPVELIPEFIKKWENKAEVVVGVRKTNNGEGFIKKTGSYWFYKIYNKISDTKTVPCSTDYRLLDRKVIDEFNKFTERNRMTRGLVDWLGFKKDFVYFDANKRMAGKAGYSSLKLIRLAIMSFVANSLFPLKLAGYLGVIITFFSGLLGLFVLVEKYFLNDPWDLHVSGSAILAIIILFLIGIVLSCLGLMALYIANIHSEVVNRPMYVIRDKKNF